MSELYFHKTALKSRFFKRFIFVASLETPCDPFEIGTDNEKFTKALASPLLDPNSCLCKTPCTADKVEDFVQFLYIKK